MKPTHGLALLLLGLTGCGAPAGGSASRPGASVKEPDAGMPSVPAASPTVDGSVAVAAAHVEENLARLQGLALFEVGDLIVGRPRAAERLGNLADAAVKAALAPYSAYACGARIDVNLEAVRSLEIVGVGAFLRTVPANNPSCQNSPCPEDIAAANMEDEARATRLESVALAVQGI